MQRRVFTSKAKLALQQDAVWKIIASCMSGTCTTLQLWEHTRTLSPISATTWGVGLVQALVRCLPTAKGQTQARSVVYRSFFFPSLLYRGSYIPKFRLRSTMWSTM